jgi:hypothetical protein
MEKEIEKLAGTEVRFWIPNTDELGVLDEMQEGFGLTMKYKTQDEWAAIKDKPLRCFYMGMRQVPNKDGEAVECAVFVSKKETFMSGQMVLIESVKSLAPKTPIQIVYRGKKKNTSSDGATNLFDVTTLE